MNRKVPGGFTRGLIALLVCVVVGAGSAVAQQRPRAVPPPPAAGQAVEQAPVIKFAPGGISLEEAVRLTLQNDPNIKQQQVKVRFQEGVTQEQRGAFDFVMNSTLSYDYRIQELDASRKTNEQTKRDNLQKDINAHAANMGTLNTVVNALTAAQNSTPGNSPVSTLQPISPTLAATVQMLDTLYNNETDPTRKAALAQQRSDFLSTSVQSYKDALTSEQSIYATEQVSLANLGPTPRDEVFYTGTLNVQFTRLFRSGISVTPYFDFSLDGTNYRGKLRDSLMGGKGLEDLFTFHAGGNFVVPLLRGRGSKVVAAGERAAATERDGQQLAVQHQMSASALATVQAYWDLRAAEDSAAIATRSAEAQTKLLDLTKQLIAADELPSIELSRAQASEARALAQAEDARRSLHQARVALATAMGLGANEDDATLPHTKDAFPAVPDLGQLAPPEVSALTTAALAERRDLAASIKHEEAGKTLQDAAVLNLKPRLDLTASSWFTALGERDFGRSISRWVGPSASVSLEMERPLGNNIYRGQLLQTEADLHQRRIASADLNRQIKLGVVQATALMRETIARLQQAQAAVGFYKSTIESETERFKTGDATLIDTVLTQEQQTEAQLTLIAAQHDLAQLIAQYRYETGTLLQAGAVNPQNLITVPARRQP
jgi:outer membrane protein TolC